MTPSSVKQLAPSRVYIPPAIHRRRIANGDWNCSAIRPGVRRIPTPMVPPTLTARPKPSPRTRRSWPDLSDAILFGESSALWFVGNLEDDFATGVAGSDLLLRPCDLGQ